MALKIKYHFVPDGNIAALEHLAPDVFYVGVGSIHHPQVFDHHAGQAGTDTTPAALIWDARKQLYESAKSLESLTIYTHRNPQWSACWGIILLEWILNGQELEETKITALNTYSSFVLSGYNPSEGPVEQSLIAVYSSVMSEIEEKERDFDVRDLKKIQTAYQFFSFCYQQFQDYSDLKTGHFFRDDGPYGKAKLHIREDHQVYLRDLQKGFRFTALLEHRTGEKLRIDGLKIEKPLSRLFKFWARNDREHSFSKAGFPLTWVQWEPNNWVLTVNPTSGYHLKGLGEFLTREEHRMIAPPLDMLNREGYDSPNPWYDARNSPGEFTIVASPHGGTQMSPRQIEKLLRRWFKVRHWQSAKTKPTWWKNNFAYFSVAASLILLAGTLYLLYPNLTELECDRRRGLPELQVSQGKHYAIVIGINDYSQSEMEDGNPWDNLNNPARDAIRIMWFLENKFHFEPVQPGGSLLMVNGATHLRLSKSIQNWFETVSHTLDQTRFSPSLGNINVQIQKLAESLTDQDSLLIYFAGHGSMSKSLGTWIPSDFKPGEDISYDRIEGILKRSDARHILVVADSCYSGKFLEEDIMRGTEDYGDTTADENTKALYQLFSRQGLTAGFLEPVSDGKRGEHSPFAGCFLRSLRKSKEFLSAHALFIQINQCMQKQSSVQKVLFSPKKDLCDQGGEFIFRKRSLF